MHADLLLARVSAAPQRAAIDGRRFRRPCARGHRALRTFRRGGGPGRCRRFSARPDFRPRSGLAEIGGFVAAPKARPEIPATPCSSGSRARREFHAIYRLTAAARGIWLAHATNCCACRAFNDPRRPAGGRGRAARGDLAAGSGLPVAATATASAATTSRSPSVTRSRSSPSTERCAAKLWRTCSSSTSTVTRVVDALVRKGCVERKRDAEDFRGRWRSRSRAYKGTGRKFERHRIGIRSSPEHTLRRSETCVTDKTNATGEQIWRFKARSPGKIPAVSAPGPCQLPMVKKYDPGWHPDRRHQRKRYFTGCSHRSL